MNKLESWKGGMVKSKLILKKYLVL